MSSMDISSVFPIMLNCSCFTSLKSLWNILSNISFTTISDLFTINLEMMRGNFPWDNIFYSYVVTFNWFIAALVYNRSNNAPTQLCPLCIGTIISTRNYFQRLSNALMQFAPISVPISMSSCWVISLLINFK